MKTDQQLKSDVIAELAFDPAIDETPIGVSVADGTVTLTGHPSSLAEKEAIESAVRRVAGVKAIVVDMLVRLPSASERPDEALATAVSNALRWTLTVPAGSVRPTVEHGWVTLDGEVVWDFQRRAALRAVRDLVGVAGVVDRIRVKPQAAAADVREKIVEALRRHANRDAKRVDIAVDGAKVTLRGTVESIAEAAAMEQAAFSAPGVAAVVNELEVES